MIEKPKLTEPNEKGYQFGINKSLTEYAQKRVESSNLPGIDLTVVEVWKDDQRVAYLFQDKKGQVIDEAQGFEAAAVKLDMHKMLQRDKDSKGK